jgi:polyisoprenoid-binding protein YceI
MMWCTRVFFGFLICLMVNLSLSAAPLEKLSIKIQGRQMGALTWGEVMDAKGDLVFDPSHPQATKLTVDVSAYQIFLPSSVLSEEIKKDAWLNAQIFPRIQFFLVKMEKKSEDLFWIDGFLSIKGVRKLVRFPTRLIMGDKQILFKGRFDIRRSDFQVGTGSWADTSLVSDEVSVFFEASQRLVVE